MTIATCIHCRTPLPDGSRFCPTCGADRTDPGTAGPRTGSRTADLAAALRGAIGDRYEVRQPLGRGGMGVVFLALDRKLDREVAIKVLPTELAHDTSFVGRFEHEARTAAKLDHPGIIPIYAVEADGDLHYFVMKFVQGRTLDAILRSGPLPIDLAQKVLWEAACGLGHAHQRGVVHRDVKPANIMLDETGRALLTDFGISKALQSTSSFTATGQVLGTPHYMSPEQAKGEEVRGASDQYSLAVVGYQMLTARLPFEDDSVHTVIYKHVFEQPPPIRLLRPEIPGFLAGTLHKALGKDPDDRFATMEDFAAAAWPEGPPPPRSGSGGVSRLSTPVTSTEAPTEISQPTARVRPAPPPPPKRRAPALLLLGLVVIVLGGGAAALWLTPVGTIVLGRTVGRTAAPPGSPQRDSTAAGAAAGAAAPAAFDTGAQPPDTMPPLPSGPASAPGREPIRPAVRQVAPPAAAPETATARQVGYLAINAIPAGTIVIDGREYGDTPQRIALAPGRHLVEIRREGYVTWSERVDITSGNDTRKRPLLKPEGG